jgi:hypothetical protein
VGKFCVHDFGRLRINKYFGNFKLIKRYPFSLLSETETYKCYCMTKKCVIVMGLIRYIITADYPRFVYSEVVNLNLLLGSGMLM